MYITVCGRKIQSSDIREINITDQRVLIDTKEDFISLRYSNEDEIKEARSWMKIKTLTNKELNDAIKLLTIICDNYINTYTQCVECPLHRKTGCMITTIPVNWTEE